MKSSISRSAAPWTESRGRRGDVQSVPRHVGVFGLKAPKVGKSPWLRNGSYLGGIAAPAMPESIAPKRDRLAGAPRGCSGA